jgi:hypothetical protein
LNRGINTAEGSVYANTVSRKLHKSDMFTATISKSTASSPIFVGNGLSSLEFGKICCTL